MPRFQELTPEKLGKVYNILQAFASQRIVGYDFSCEISVEDAHEDYLKMRTMLVST